MLLRVFGQWFSIFIDIPSNLVLPIPHECRSVLFQRLKCVGTVVVIAGCKVSYTNFAHNVEFFLSCSQWVSGRGLSSLQISLLNLASLFHMTVEVSFPNSLVFVIKVEVTACCRVSCMIIANNS